MQNHIIQKILSALGYDHNIKIDEELYKREYALVEKALQDLLTVAKSKVLYKVLAVENPEHKAFLEEKILLGKSVNEFLGRPTHVIICGTTLGSQVDQLIRKAQIESISSAVTIDTAAMVVIEENLDSWVEEIKRLERFKNVYFSPRYSPGYGDMPLTVQKNILQELQSQKQIGLTVSQSGILLPKKSVTAVIGIYDEAFLTTYSNCDSCLIRNICKKRERGDYCGY